MQWRRRPSTVLELPLGWEVVAMHFWCQVQHSKTVTHGYPSHISVPWCIHKNIDFIFSLLFTFFIPLISNSSSLSLFFPVRFWPIPRHSLLCSVYFKDTRKDWLAYYYELICFCHTIVCSIILPQIQWSHFFGWFPVGNLVDYRSSQLCYICHYRRLMQGKFVLSPVHFPPCYSSERGNL